MDPDAVNPWNFATVEGFAARLTAPGLIDISLLSRPTPVPAALVARLKTFAKSHAGGLASAARAGMFAEVAAACAGTLRGIDGAWRLDCVRLRSRARRPAGSGSTPTGARVLAR
jgi:hypothetical protein